MKAGDFKGLHIQSDKSADVPSDEKSFKNKQLKRKSKKSLEKASCAQDILPIVNILPDDPDNSPHPADPTGRRSHPQREYRKINALPGAADKCHSPAQTQRHPRARAQRSGQEGW